MKSNSNFGANQFNSKHAVYVYGRKLFFKSRCAIISGRVVIDKCCEIKLIAKCLQGDTDSELKRICTSNCEVLFLD